jgi:hypothetical protein
MVERSSRAARRTRCGYDAERPETMSKHTITSGKDGETGAVIGYADDMCHALAQIERLLGGRENALRIPPINRGNECFMFCFISEGKSLWVRTQRERRVNIESVRAFADVEPHRDYSIYA